MASPTWISPKDWALGHLVTLELREDDPAQPPLPRPGEERLGPLAVRGVDALKDGRGWRITVQPMAPGSALIPPLDLGDGRRTPELRITVPRTVPTGAPWVGVGGGQQDVLPYIPFPWEWGTLAVLPLAALGWLLARKWNRGRASRKRKTAQRAFIRHWPPAGPDRAALDAAHASGRELLASIHGEEARSWSPATLEARGLEAWSHWARSLDAARFSRQAPAYPSLASLLAALEDL